MIFVRSIAMPALFALSGLLSPLGRDVLEASEEPAADVVPPPVADTSTPPARRITTVDRARDGLFYVDVVVKDQRLRLVVDTGASHVVLSTRDAARLGLRAGRSVGAIRTASGLSRSSWSRIPALSVGHTRVADVDVVLMRSGPPTSLMGQNLLSRLGPVQIRGDQLTLG